jgi:hypothetical protein
MNESIRQFFAALKLLIHPHYEKNDWRMGVPRLNHCIGYKAVLVSKVTCGGVFCHKPGTQSLQSVLYTFDKILDPWFLLSFLCSHLSFNPSKAKST